MKFGLTIIILVAIAWLIFKIVKTIASRIFGVVLVLGLLLAVTYHYSIGPFEQNMGDIEELKEKYNTSDQDIYECIVLLAENDMKSRFTASEMDSLSQQKIKAVYVLGKSLQATRVEALACLAAKDAEHKYKVFIQDFVPIENEYLDQFESKAKEITEKLKGEYDSFNDDKQGIDEKY